MLREVVKAYTAISDGTELDTNSSIITEMHQEDKYSTAVLLGGRLPVLVYSSALSWCFGQLQERNISDELGMSGTERLPGDDDFLAEIQTQ